MCLKIKIAVLFSGMLFLSACVHDPNGYRRQSANSYSSPDSGTPSTSTSVSDVDSFRKKPYSSAIVPDSAIAYSSDISQGYSGGGEMLPPNPKPGECYARSWVPPKFELRKSRVLVDEGGEKLQVIPARYRSVRKKVKVQDASEKLKTIPATYKTVTERIEVQPASTKLISVPAVYENVVERVLVKEGYTTWKKGTGPYQRIDGDTGDIMCLVEVPPEYKTVIKRRLKKPASTHKKVIPAKYRTVTRRVVDKPERTISIPVPAVYRTVTVNEEVSPASTRVLKTPPKYKTVTRKVKIRDGAMRWVEVVCATNMTRSKIREIQKALKIKGFDPGPIDGIIKRQTMAAVNRFQVSSGLAKSNYLTIDTVKALGVSPR